MTQHLTCDMQLTHFPLNKMATISQTIYSEAFFVNEKFSILIHIPLKFVPKGPFDNKVALAQLMAWCRIGDKPLSEPMLTRLTDAYMQHLGEMN